MNPKHTGQLALLLLLGTAAVGADLGEEGDADPAGKFRAPISFAYEILGNPIVGQPIAINLQVSSSQSDTITVEYRIIDSSSMIFPESQALKVEVSPSSDDVPAQQQITVVPQREGRLYLNVSGSIETENGPMIRATAIPIQVGSAPREQQVNGETQEMPDGETVISMPAEEN